MVQSDLRVKFGAFPLLRAIGTPPAKYQTNRRNRLRCSENRKVDPMKTMFAQAATFALSALGALAIFVGTIDQPRLVYDAAAATPAVSHLA